MNTHSLRARVNIFGNRSFGWISDDGLASRDLMIHHDRGSPGLQRNSKLIAFTQAYRRLCDYKQQLCIH